MLEPQPTIIHNASGYVTAAIILPSSTDSAFKYLERPFQWLG